MLVSKMVGRFFLLSQVGVKVPLNTHFWKGIPIRKKIGICKFLLASKIARFFVFSTNSWKKKAHSRFKMSLNLIGMLLCSIFLPFVLGNCSLLSTCSTCSFATNCVWCNSTSTCMAGKQVKTAAIWELKSKKNSYTIQNRIPK